MLPGLLYKIGNHLHNKIAIIDQYRQFRPLVNFGLNKFVEENRVLKDSLGSGLEYPLVML